MERKVIIRRKEVLNHLPKEIRAGAKIKLGSMFVDRLPLKGVDGDEEATLLKNFIDVPAGHQEWPAKTKDFWASLNLKVPFEGAELEIGTYEDGSPINTMDYIYYKWCLKHRHVAMSEEEMKVDANKRFYIYDPQKDLLKKNAKVQVKKDADKEFIKLTGNIEKMKMLLRVLVDGDPERLSDMEIENTLYDYKGNSPEKFLKYCTDDNLEVQAEIEEMVAKDVLRRIGNQVIFQDETIGEDMKDAIVYFKNKKNSGQVNTMRARLKEVS
jgi:hypothetical protein